MFKIYLAGAMTGLTKEQRNGWRVDVKRQLLQISSLKIINPCDYYDFDLIDANTTDKEIKEFDLYQVRTSDLILVDLTFPNSIGTAIELQVAFDNHIPIIAYGFPTEPIHPWIKETITKFCKTRKEAIEHITQYYL